MNTCPLCKQIYHLPEELMGETIPIYKYGHMLETPEVYAFGLFYLFCGHMSFLNKQPEVYTLYGNMYVISFESIYLILFSINWVVRAKGEYWRHFQENNIYLLGLYHVLIWASIFTLDTKYPLLLLPYSLHSLWKSHCELLELRNEDIIPRAH